MNSPATTALAALGWTEAAPGPASPTLTPDDEAALLARSATIHYARASLRVQRTPIPGEPDLHERRFLMEGPSGRHSLLVDATDLDRLNAHWTVFASHPKNAHAGASQQ